MIEESKFGVLIFCYSTLSMIETEFVMSMADGCSVGIELS